MSTRSEENTQGQPKSYVYEVKYYRIYVRLGIELVPISQRGKTSKFTGHLVDLEVFCLSSSETLALAFML